MNIKPIKTEDDYEAVLARIEALFEAKPNTPQGDELDVLITLVSAYEDEHYPIAAADPVEVIKHVMEAKGLEMNDMIPFIGSRSKVSEVINKKRSLSLNMIRRLSHGLHISADVLVKEYELRS
jgi:HTH-type transcriptional regulator / antitoxin HigA